MTDHDPAIVAALDALEKQLPELLLANPDEADFWPKFSGTADSIVDSAPAGDSEYVRGRIDCMLKNQGVIPGEDEGEPCG